jgi:hypothetical protein
MPLKPDGSACDSGADPSSLVGMASAQCGGASQSRCPSATWSAAPAGWLQDYKTIFLCHLRRGKSNLRACL